VFYVNLAPGLAMLAALWWALPKSASQFGLLRQGDWIGISLMAIGLAAFQTVLDDGNVYNWFASPFIVKLSLLAAAALAGFVLYEFVIPRPLVDFRLLGRRNSGSHVQQLPAGFRALRVAYLLPQYLAVAQGFDSEQVGEVVAWTGLPQLLIIRCAIADAAHRRAPVGGCRPHDFRRSCFMNLWLDQDMRRRNSSGPT